MNNVIKLPVERPATFSPNSELYFDVWERPLAFFGQKKDPAYQVDSHKAIVRLWRDKPISIGIVGKNYKLLKNRELCESIEDTFMDTLTTEELHNVQRIDEISHMGGTSIRQYVFPGIVTDIGSTKSDIAFRTIIVNGYDGTSSFKFYHGAIDFFCSNGMVSGIYDMTVRRHTAGLTIPRLTDKLRQSIDIFYKQSERWKHWVGKTICDEDAEECFRAIPNISERRIQQFMRQFRIECQSHGRTVWALYSTATFYASRSEGDFTIRETSSDHQASTLLNREQQIRGWLNTQEFERIAA